MDISRHIDRLTIAIRCANMSVMPRNRDYGRCRICNGYATPDNRLSARGRHYDCSTNRVVDTVTQLHEKDGPYYEKWRANLLAGMIRETGDRGGGVSRLSET